MQEDMSSGMNKELAFAKKLEEIRKLAKEQGNVISKEQVEEAFAEIEIEREQLEPVFEYLKSKNIGIGEPVDIEEVLSKEDKNYLEEYLEALKELPVLSEGEKRADDIVSDVQEKSEEIMSKLSDMLGKKEEGAEA